jgi:hypothetical protein
MANNFQIGDNVIYNPDIIPLPPAKDRPWDHGVIVAMDEQYATVQFTESKSKHKILFYGISYYIPEPIELN